MEENKQTAIDAYNKSTGPIEIVEIVNQMQKDGKSDDEILDYLKNYVIDRLCEIAYPDPKDAEKKEELKKLLQERAEKIPVRYKSEMSSDLRERSNSAGAKAFYNPAENAIYIPDLTKDSIFDFTGNFIHEFLHGLSIKDHHL